jgi:hypothetical protein
MSGRYLTAAALRELENRLTEHDLSVLQRVSDLRFVTGDQLTRLHFADTDDQATNGRAARRALLRLTRLGALKRLPRQVGGVRAGSAGFVYHLGLGGQRLALGWQPERRRRRSLVPGTLFVRHSLQVSELHTRLVEADRSRRFELLELSGEPSCWRSWDGFVAQRQTLKPDSYARLGAGAYEYSYFIEIDRGTEGSRTIVRQMGVYIDYHASGIEQQSRGVFPLVLWLAPDSKRVAAIEDSVERLPRADRELFQVARFDQAIEAVAAADPSEVT